MACVTYPNEFSVPENVEEPIVNFDASLDATVIGDFDDIDAAPATNVVERTDKLQVKVEWEIHGQSLWVSQDNQFRLTLFIESIGPGPELAFPGGIVTQLSVAAAPCGGGQVQRVYSQLITVPPNTLPAGVYKLVTLVQWESKGGVKYEVAGLVEEPIVNIIETPGS